MSQKQIQIQSAVSDPFYYNFMANQHVETKKEEGYSIYKAEFNFVYNWEAKLYENYIIQNKPPELDLINFYNLVDRYADNTKFDFKGYFQKDLVEKINNPTIKTTILPNLKKYSLFIDYLPYYTEIIFDNVLYSVSKMSQLFKEYNIQDKVLEYFSKNQNNLTYVEISSGILFDNDIAKEPSFFQKFNNIIDKSAINIAQANNKEETYFEVIGYKISKYYGSKGFKDAVQEWYILNTSDEKNRFIDSQIIYEKNYFYKISMITATIGLKKDGTSSVLLMETESTGYEGYLLESPPVHPDLYFATYSGDTNKIKVLLNGIVDKYESKPIKILQSDVEQIKKILNSDLAKGDKVTYESKDTVKKFQVIRLDVAPSSYEDFAFGKIVNIPSGLTTFEDDIEQNKKYYYIARSIDFHEHFSNPTEVFTVEIINDLETVYPIFGIYEFKKDEELKELSKKFNKVLSLQPRLAHLIYDENRNKGLEQKTDQNTILQTVNIGTTTPEIWDKNFKVRITSLSTGKKIDLNLKFKKNRLQKK